MSSVLAERLSIRAAYLLMAIGIGLSAALGLLSPLRNRHHSDAPVGASEPR